MYKIKFIYLNLIIIYIILIVIFNNINKKFILHKDECAFNKKINLNNVFLKISSSYKSIINKYKRSSIIWPIWNKIKFKPYMTNKDIIVLSYFMNPKNVYFEFGSGGSTNLASYYKVKTYSVESDVYWHKILKKNGIKAKYITIDLKVGSFGYPGENTNIYDWKKYIQAYQKKYNADVILIDGRFRVACTLDLFSKIRNDTIILIHDYVNRKKYHIIEKFYIKIKSWDSLALFIKNPNIEFIPKNIYNNYLKEKL